MHADIFARALKIVPLDLVVQGPARNPQDLAGAGAVAAGRFHGPDNELLFHLFDAHPHTDGHGDLFIVAMAQADGQVAGLEQIAGAIDHGALNDVFQFTHIARPRIGLQAGYKIG